MKKFIGLLFALPFALAGPSNADRGDRGPHPPPIASISVCSRDSHDGMLQQGSCDWGTFDTHQLVLGPEGTSVNTSNGLGAGIPVVPDEHSSVFRPWTLGTNHDYLFFLATGLGGNAHIGVSVLSGGAGPDRFGQWTLNLPTDGYGDYGTQFGPVFNPSTKGSICPGAPMNDKTQQDQTFDMHYAASGSIVVDPTATPGSLLMVYEGTNACIGNPGGPIFGDNDDYISVAIATSLDYGKTWPVYRGNPPAFKFAPLPGVNPSQGPNKPMGALGADVCMGNDCSTTPPASYGRYPVVTPTTSLDTLMKAGVALGAKYGEQEISGFVDDVSRIFPPYLYVNSGDVRIARALLNGGSAPLTFEKWNGHHYTSPGLGGDEASVLPVGPGGSFQNCLADAQNQFGSSISYVDSTKQYLLTFVCVSLGDPRFGPNQPGALRGAAWFYATSYDPSDPAQWSNPDPIGNPQPREIEGSWSPFDQASIACPSFKGWYPTFMSLDTNPGHLSNSGHVFYLYGCQGGGGGEAPPRQFSSRAFKITTAAGHHELE
jgi:hypothetical protein